MAKRFKKSDRPKDINQLAHHLVNLSTGNIDTDSPKPSKRKSSKKPAGHASK
jgi:hypothetical protein